MAPRKGETAAEKSVRNAQKCQLFARKAKYEAILACMRAHYGNVYRIHEFCVQAGMISGDPQSTAAQPDDPAQLAITDDSNSSVDGALFQTRGEKNSSAAGSATLFLSDAEVSRGEASVVSLDAMVNYTNAYQWRLLPVSTLEALLRACLPQIFTVVAVKAMCVRGARKKPGYARRLFGARNEPFAEWECAKEHDLTRFDRRGD
jgi:hypothetical protein